MQRIYNSIKRTDMKKEKTLIQTLTIRISKTLIDEYKKYCDDNGLLMSKRIRYLINKDIDNKINIIK